MEYKITAITSRQAVMAGYVPPLDNIINNITVVYSDKNKGLIRLLLKLINKLDKQNKLMFITLLNKYNEIIKRATSYSDINLTLNNIYIVDNSKIRIEEIINIIKEREIKVLVIDSFGLLDKVKINKKVLLKSLYNLKNHGITVIIGMDLTQTDTDLMDYTIDVGNVIMISE